jgi:ABC-type Fe3+ transport system permease subunit
LRLRPFHRKGNARHADTLAGYRRGQGHSLVFKVTLPLLRSSLLSGAIFAFIISFSDINLAWHTRSLGHRLSASWRRR